MGQRFLALCVMFTGLILRLPGLGQRAMDGDQAMHLMPRSLIDTLQFDLRFNPPLFRLLEHLVTALDRSAFCARLVPVAAGVASVGLVYLLGRRLAGRSAGLVAAFWLAISPWHIRHSMTIRTYSLFGMLVLLLFLLTLRRDERERPNPWPHAVVYFLLVWTHYLAPFFLVADQWLLRGRMPWRHRLIPIAAAGAALAWPAWHILTSDALAAKTGSGGLVSAGPGAAFILDWFRAACATGGLAALAWLALLGAAAWRRRLAPLLLAGGGYLALVAILGWFVPVEIRYALPAQALLFLPAAALLTGDQAAPSAWLRLLAFCLLTLGLAAPLPAFLSRGEEHPTLRALHSDYLMAEDDPGRITATWRSACGPGPCRVTVQGLRTAPYGVAASLYGGRLPDDAREETAPGSAVLIAGPWRIERVESGCSTAADGPRLHWSLRRRDDRPDPTCRPAHCFDTERLVACRCGGKP